MGDFGNQTPAGECAITLEQHRRLNLTRPYTDTTAYDAQAGIGGKTAQKRDAGARASRAVTITTDPYDIRTRTNPTQVDVDANHRDWYKRSRGTVPADRRVRPPGWRVGDTWSNTPPDPTNPAEGHTAQ